MKKINLFLFSLLFLLICSCQKNDVFTGSPLDSSVTFENIIGAISTTETVTVASQKIPVKIVLPFAFDKDVNILVTSYCKNNNKRSISILTMPKGNTVLEDFVSSPPTDANTILNFNLESETFLSGISTVSNPPTPSGFAGKQYSLSSNSIKLRFGDTVLPVLNANKCSFRFDYENPKYDASVTSFNDLNLILKRSDGSVVTLATPATAVIHGTPTNSANASRYESIVFLNDAPVGVYIVSVYAKVLKQIPLTKLDYRFAIRLPGDKSKSFFGTLQNVSLGSASNTIDILRINKTLVNSKPEYELTQL